LFSVGGVGEGEREGEEGRDQIEDRLLVWPQLESIEERKEIEEGEVGQEKQAFLSLNQTAGTQRRQGHRGQVQRLGHQSHQEIRNTDGGRNLVGFG
jgi:hypothetical protein